MPLTEQQKRELATSSVSAWYSHLFDVAMAEDSIFAAFVATHFPGRICLAAPGLDGQPWASVAGSKEATA